MLGFTPFSAAPFSDSEYAVDSAVSVTGVEATGQTGDEFVIGTAVIIEDGVEGLGQTGDLTVFVTFVVLVNGVEATGEIGDEFVIGTAVVIEDGVEGTGAVGNVTASAEGKHIETAGVAATGQIGTVQALSVTGVQGTTELGTVFISAGVRIYADGNEATGELGEEFVVTDQVIAVGTVFGICVEGSVTTGIIANVDVTGVEATAELGTVTQRSTYPVTGVAATGQLGTVTVKVTYTVTGVSATGRVGSQSPAPNVWGLINTNQDPNWIQIAA